MAKKVYENVHELGPKMSVLSVFVRY